MRTRLIATFGSAWLLLLLLIAGQGGDVAYATSFRPGYPTATLTDSTPGAHPNTAIQFDIPSPDANFSRVVAYFDSLFTIADDNAIPNGGIVGNLSSSARLGLVNGPCATATPVTFVFLDSDTSTTDTIPPTGPPDNRLLNLTQDNRGANPGDPPNGLPDYVDANPTYNNTLTTPDGGGTPVQARARYAGHVDVAGLLVILQFLLFDAGALLVLPNGEFNAAVLGYPSPSSRTQRPLPPTAPSLTFVHPSPPLPPCLAYLRITAAPPIPSPRPAAA